VARRAALGTALMALAPASSRRKCANADARERGGEEAKGAASGGRSRGRAPSQVAIRRCKLRSTGLSSSFARPLDAAPEATVEGSTW